MNPVKIIFLIVFFAILKNSFAQSYSDVDEKTYDFYTVKDWKGLIKYSKKNIDFKKVDYYYLRMRLGIAYFEKGNFLNAIKHFKKALDFNEASSLAKEYLFYCYKFTFQNTLAKNVYDNIPVKDVEKITPLKNKLFKSTKVEIGINLSDNFEKNQNVCDFGEEEIYSEAKFFGNTKYFHFGLEHQFTNAFSINHGISRFGIDNKKKFCFSDSNSVFDYTTKQTDYYFNANYTFRKGLKFSIALHTISVSFTEPIMEYSDSKYTLSINENKMTDFLLYANIGSFYKKIYWQTAFSFSSINGSIQNQINLDISWLLFGNYKLVPGIKFVSYYQTNKTDKSSINEIIFEPHISLSLSKNIWIDASYTFGDLYNYHENDAFIIYNNPEKITKKAEALLNFEISKNLIFYTKYSLMNRESNRITYFTEDDYNTNSFNFTTNYIIGGITWTF